MVLFFNAPRLMPDYVTIMLPYPPSVNSLYRCGKNGRIYMSQKGHDYKDVVFGDAQQQIGNGVATCCPVEVIYGVTLPDRRVRDLSNLYKILDDSLEGILFKNDSQIWKSAAYRVGIDHPGSIKVYCRKVSDDIIKSGGYGQKT